MSPHFSLPTTTILITGAAGGLGKTIANAFLRSGANVSICDVHLQRIQECEQEWSALYPGRFLAIEADVADEESLEKFFTATIAKFGKLDMVVNNAGILGDFSPSGTCSVQLWERVLAVNLTGSFLATKFAVNHFSEQDPEGGIIINIGSETSLRSTKSGAAYTVSKHGLDGLTKNTANFYGPQGVSCIGLALGPMVGTNIFDPVKDSLHAAFEGKMKDLTKSFEPAKHALPLESVAEYCLFLSDRRIAAASNGSCIELRGNWSLQ